jgi:hypothetical protein
VKRQKFKPVTISLTSPEDIFETRKRDVSTAIINAIEHATPKRIKRIDFVELIFNGQVTVRLTIDRKDFSELIDKNVKILEELEEYELCAKGIKLKEKLTKNTKKQSLEN